MKKIYALILFLVACAFLNLENPVYSDSALNLENPISTQVSRSYISVNPLDVVASPSRYMNKYIKIKAKFDKFSTLGLDYTPAMRSSEEYISFLIQRNDVTDHNIPLSEMKIFMKRADAEKHIDLDSGDEIEFCGKVFSSALGDAWVDVEKFTVLTIKPAKKLKN